MFCIHIAVFMNYFNYSKNTMSFNGIVASFINWIPKLRDYIDRYIFTVLTAFIQFGWHILHGLLISIQFSFQLAKNLLSPLQFRVNIEPQFVLQKSGANIGFLWPLHSWLDWAKSMFSVLMFDQQITSARHVYFVGC